MISPLAGLPAPANILIDVDSLISAYYTIPDLFNPLQRVIFGTSGHRGSALKGTFNEVHILAITQAICLYREYQNITGPLFIGIDTHALSAPAFHTALEVLAANHVHLMIAPNHQYTPTPAVSLAILNYNKNKKKHLADGMIITPSHNPPDQGGLKYNPPNGGPASSNVTKWIEKKANEILIHGLNHIKRRHVKQAIAANTTHYYDFMTTYVSELEKVIDMPAIRAQGIRMAVHPLGGAGVHYWSLIAERYKLDLTVLDAQVDPQFSFMCADWDGQIRMDPSSVYAMQVLIKQKDHYTVSFACDTDHDRHGIVTPNAGLIPPNHYLTVAIDYLFNYRTEWSPKAAIGKTAVSSQIIDRLATELGREIYEVPVGFKWFVPGLESGNLGFAGEESAGVSFLRRNGKVWTTDKDGIIAALLSAEIIAHTGRDPAEIYQSLNQKLGHSFASRFQASANAKQRAQLANISAQKMQLTSLAQDPIVSISTHASGNNAALGGVKVVSAHGWFAVRPSGTEDIYKIYAESFKSPEHLGLIMAQAQTFIEAIFQE